MQTTITKKQIKMIEKMEEVQSKLGELIWQRGIEKFKITQMNKKMITKIVEVVGLDIDFENDHIMFTDLEDKIIDERLVLMIFLADSLKDVVITDDYIRLDFIAGDNITIEVIR